MSKPSVQWSRQEQRIAPYFLVDVSGGCSTNRGCRDGSPLYSWNKYDRGDIGDLEHG